MKDSEIPKQHPKMSKSGDVGSKLRENSTFYGDESVTKMQKKLYKTSLSNFRKQKTNKHTFSSTFLNKNVKNLRCLGMSDMQSSSTFQNSVYSWSFPKSHRFVDNFTRASNESLYNLPNKRNMRHTTQGFGERKDLRPKVGSCSPPPGTYRIKSLFEINLEKREGRSILEKVPQLPHPGRDFPGPDTYRAEDCKMEKSLPIKLKSRIFYFYDEDLAKQKHCISPQTYLPSTKMEQSWRYTKLSFGKGNRSPSENAGKRKLYVAMRHMPGPGTYNIPSVFDKKGKYKVALN